MTFTCRAGQHDDRRYLAAVRRRLHRGEAGPGLGLKAEAEAEAATGA